MSSRTALMTAALCAQTALPPLPDAVAGCRGAHPEPLLSCSQVAPLPLLSAFFSALDAQVGAHTQAIRLCWQGLPLARS